MKRKDPAVRSRLTKAKLREVELVLSRACEAALEQDVLLDDMVQPRRDAKNHYTFSTIPWMSDEQPQPQTNRPCGCLFAALLDGKPSRWGNYQRDAAARLHITHNRAREIERGLMCDDPEDHRLPPCKAIGARLRDRYFIVKDLP